MVIDYSQSFKLEAAPVGKTANIVNNTNSSWKNTKIVVPLKYLSNFRRSLEMPLINCKICLQLKWFEDCILSSAGDSAKFKIIDARLHVPITTLSTKDNVNLTKHLSDRFERCIYWNNYKTVPTNVINQGTNIYGLLAHDFKVLNDDFFFLLIMLLQMMEMLQTIKQV